MLCLASVRSLLLRETKQRFIPCFFHPLSRFYPVSIPFLSLFYPASSHVQMTFRILFFCLQKLAHVSRAGLLLPIPLRLVFFRVMASAQNNFLAPPLPEILASLGDVKEHGELIRQFLLSTGLDLSTLMPILSFQDGILAAYGDYLRAKGRFSPEYIAIAVLIMRAFLEKCAQRVAGQHQLKRTGSDCSQDSQGSFGSEASSASSGTRLTEEIFELALSPKKREADKALEAALSISPKKEKALRSPGFSKRVKKFGPGRLLLLNQTNPFFWNLLLHFVALLDPNHAAELLCPVCEKTLGVENPHNFHSHIQKKHSECYATCPRPAPSHLLVSPFPKKLEGQLKELPEPALLQVPPLWLAVMPQSCLPESVRRFVQHSQPLAIDQHHTREHSPSAIHPLPLDLAVLGGASDLELFPQQPPM